MRLMRLLVWRSLHSVRSTVKPNHSCWGLLPATMARGQRAKAVVEYEELSSSDPEEFEDEGNGRHAVGGMLSSSPCLQARDCAA